MDLKTALFTAQGRLSREAFLYAYALVWLCGFAAGGVTTSLRDNGLHEANLFWTPLSMTVQGVAIFCLATKRAHDLGRAGWRVVLMFLAMLFVWDMAYNIVELALSARDTPTQGAAWGPALLEGLAEPTGLKISALLSWYGVFVWLAASKGQEGPNRYGEPGPRRLSFA